MSKSEEELAAEKRTVPNAPVSFEPREWVAASLSVGLLLAFIGALTGTYMYASEKEPDFFVRSKDLLSIVASFLGTVMGYYFGKNPAEKSAEAARGEADATRKEADATRKEADATEEKLKQQQQSARTAGEQLDAALDLIRGQSTREAIAPLSNELIRRLETAREQLRR